MLGTSVVPPGLGSICPPYPALEALGYCRDAPPGLRPSSDYRAPRTRLPLARAIPAAGICEKISGLVTAFLIGSVLYRMRVSRPRVSGDPRGMTFEPSRLQ